MAALLGDASGAPRFIALRRNEMKDHSWSTDEIIQWALGKAEPKPLFADADKEVLGNADERGRTQRQTMALRDVRYRLHAEIRPWPRVPERASSDGSSVQRRAAAGQCIYQPYLGCREFPAYFRLCEDKPAEPAAPINLDVGWMLTTSSICHALAAVPDAACISFFRAVVRSGVLDVPNTPVTRCASHTEGTMIDRLVSYARSEGLIAEPGFTPKEVKWAVDISDGRYAGVFLSLGDPS